MQSKKRRHGQGRRAGDRFEWQTWLIVLAVYGCWAPLTWFHAAIPLWVLLPVGALVVAWHGSLQHETIHGHPTRRRWLNSALAWPPLGLWMPYELYRTSHLAHHDNAILTDPIEDPESFYLTTAAWARLGPVRRALYHANQTLLGRLVIGPALVVAHFYADEARLVVLGAPGRRSIWLRHAFGVAAVLVWVTAVSGLPAWLYLVGICYPGLSLTLLRSFVEHRQAADPEARTAVVHAGPLFGLLFLNNNLHVAHHARPGTAWYRLPAYNRQIGADSVAARGAGLYVGYRAVARRFLLRPHGHPVHLAEHAG